MSVDWQLLIVSAAAGAAAVYSLRRVLLQFERPDDEPGGCRGCPANRIELTGRRRKGDAL